MADWWRMINEFQCGCIVMLCQLQEEGKVGLTTPAQVSASTSQTAVGELLLFVARGGRRVCGAWETEHETGVSEDSWRHCE